MNGLWLTVIFLFSLNAHILVFWKDTAEPDECYMVDYESFWFDVWFWIDTIMYMGIPFTVIVICNLIILFRVSQSQLQRAKMKGSNDESAKGVRLTSTTYMLITVSIMFLLLTLPSSIYYVLRGLLPAIVYNPQYVANLELFNPLATVLAKRRELQPPL